MARPGVTYTEVENSAKRLLAEGKQPTIDAIRILIGSGSDTTIMRHLKAWKDRHSLESQSGGIPLPLMETIQGLWSRLKAEASNELNNLKAQVNEEVEALREVLNRSKAEQNTLKGENEGMRASLTEAQTKIKELTSLLQAEKMENVRLQEQASGLERQCTQQAGEIARLNQISKQAHDNLVHYQDMNLKLKDEHILERDKERQQHFQAIRVLESQLHEATQKNATFEHMLKHAEKTLSDADQTMNQLRNRCETIANEASENKTKIALLEHQNHVLTQQTTEQDQHLKECSEQLCNALNQINLLTNKQDLLEVSLQKAEDKTQALMDEKLFWVQEKVELVEQMKLQKSSN